MVLVILLAQVKLNTRTLEDPLVLPASSVDDGGDAAVGCEILILVPQEGVA